MGGDGSDGSDRFFASASATLGRPASEKSSQSTHVHAIFLRPGPLLPTFFFFQPFQCLARDNVICLHAVPCVISRWYPKWTCNVSRSSTPPTPPANPCATCCWASSPSGSKPN